MYTYKNRPCLYVFTYIYVHTCIYIYIYIYVDVYHIYARMLQLFCIQSRRCLKARLQWSYSKVVQGSRNELML